MTHSIGMLAVPNCMASSITGPYDFFSIASYEWQRLAPHHRQPLFQTTVVTPTGTAVSAFNGLSIQADSPIAEDTLFDIIFIPVIFGDLTSTLADTPIQSWLIRQYHAGACLTSVCAGSFLIAQTGLLDGKRATTHWKLAQDFTQRYPKIILQQEKILIDEGDIITAGGVSSYLDLSLYLAGRYGSYELSSSLSKILLIDPGRTTQSPYTTYTTTIRHADREIAFIQEWLEKHYDNQVTITSLAGRAGLGERTFNRRFKKATGESPLEYLQRVRIEAARYILETTTETIDEITVKVGYEDTSSFRKLFKRCTGLSPLVYRRKFFFLP